MSAQQWINDLDGILSGSISPNLIGIGKGVASEWAKGINSEYGSVCTESGNTISVGLESLTIDLDFTDDVCTSVRFEEGF